MRYHKKFILFIILLVVLLSFPACTCNHKGDSKLDFNVKRLIEAEKRGEAEEFAQPRNIELIDGSSVRVIIECLPGQVDMVAQEASSFGTVELSTMRGVQAVVPINNLTALADLPSVRLVRLPWVAVSN